MSDIKNKQVHLLQQNLNSIRKIAGWTTEQLGEKLGVTKQTISNLENFKVPMTVIQYIAIRSVLDLEIERNKENTILPKVIDILVDNGDEFEERDYCELKDSLDTVAASAMIGKKGEQLSKIFTSLITSPGTISALTIMGAALIKSGTVDKFMDITVDSSRNWLKKIVK